MVIHEQFVTIHDWLVSACGDLQAFGSDLQVICGDLWVIHE